MAVGGDRLISASAVIADAPAGKVERYGVEPGLYHLATRQGSRVCAYSAIPETNFKHNLPLTFCASILTGLGISGISAELELGDDAMATADLEAQTNAILNTVEQVLRESQTRGGWGR